MFPRNTALPRCNPLMGSSHTIGRMWGDFKYFREAPDPSGGWRNLRPPPQEGNGTGPFRRLAQLETAAIPLLLPQQGRRLVGRRKPQFENGYLSNNRICSGKPGWLSNLRSSLQNRVGWEGCG